MSRTHRCRNAIIKGAAHKLQMQILQTWKNQSGTLHSGEAPTMISIN